MVPCLTTDDRLIENLQRALGDPAEVVSCASWPDVREHLDSATWAVFDLRHVEDGGHSAAGQLESLRERHPELPAIALVDADAPERLERAIVEHGFTRVTEPAAVLERLRELCETADAPGSETPADPRPTEAGERTRSVLQGLTRRFETNTLRLQRMLTELEVAARHDVTILLIGETGSGKTFLSRLIHEVSPRRDEPFLHVACGALPGDLVESELFGHAKGAFTSASADKEGKFLAAGRGTILLDEIDVLEPEQQVKLLRVIETGEFEPVGSNRTHRSQARLVVASNLDLQPLVERGRFRPDLYYRLNMLKFVVPPLRERREDLEPLARKFVRELSAKHGAHVVEIDASVLKALRAYPWPGNVRELENVIRRAVIYCTDGVLRVEHLPANVVACDAGPTNDPSIRLGGAAEPDASLGSQMASTEREIIEQALFKHDYSKTRAARELGISRVTLYNKLKKHSMM